MSEQFEFSENYIVTPNFGPVTGIQRMGNDLYVFTKDGIFKVKEKKIRWWDILKWKINHWLNER